MNAPVKVSACTYGSVKDLIDKMEKGQSLIYHVGSLMFDKMRGANFMTVGGVAKAAWEAHVAGQVHLVQRKLGFCKFEYIAIRR